MYIISQAWWTSQLEIKTLLLWRKRNGNGKQWTWEIYLYFSVAATWITVSLHATKNRTKNNHTNRQSTSLKILCESKRFKFALQIWQVLDSVSFYCRPAHLILRQSHHSPKYIWEAKSVIIWNWHCLGIALPHSFGPWQKTGTLFLVI